MGSAPRGMYFSDRTHIRRASDDCPKPCHAFACGIFRFRPCRGAGRNSYLKVIVRGGISGRARIARHAWRMCVALFIATGSFFLGQQKVMPAWIQGSTTLTLLGVAPLVLMFFWLIRIRFSGAYRKMSITSVHQLNSL